MSENLFNVNDVSLSDIGYKDKLKSHHIYFHLVNKIVDLVTNFAEFNKLHYDTGSYYSETSHLDSNDNSIGTSPKPFGKVVRFVEETSEYILSGSNDIAVSGSLDSSSSNPCISSRVLRSNVRNSDPVSSTNSYTVHDDNPVYEEGDYVKSSSSVDFATLTSTTVNSRSLRKRSLPASDVIISMATPRTSRSQGRVGAFEHLAASPTAEGPALILLKMLA